MARASENTFSNDLSPDAEWSIAAHAAPPPRLPEKVQAAFQCHKTVQKQPAHSKQAVAAQIFSPLDTR